MPAFDFQPEFRKTVLSNGVRVVTERHPFARSISAAIYANFGTRDEPRGMSGAAHFVEHLVFKGTQTRSAFAIAKSLEAVGGDLNAFTSRELTCFHTLSLREHLPLSLDILIDLIRNAVFAEKEFEKEKEVIFQEIDMSADLIEEYIFDLFFERVYNRQALGRPILGTRRSLQKISRRQLYDFYRQRYVGENLVLSVAGDVDHDLVVKLIDKSLGRSRKNGKLSRIRRIKPKYRPFTEVRARPSEQVHILVGVPSGSFKDPLRFESYIVNALLGGGMTSRLYQKVREERGLVYSIYSQLQSFTDSGLMMVYAGASEKNAPKVLSVMYKELKRLIDKSLGKRDLEFFKTQVKGAILLGSDDMESRMNSIAVNEIVFGEYKPVDEIIDQIDRITLNSIHQYLHTYFNLKEACVMLMGDLNEEIGKNWVKECFRE